MTAYAIRLEEIERRHTSPRGVVKLGPAAHYLLTEPHDGHTRIVISSSTVMGEPECYAFSTNSWSGGEGMSELSMSQKGTLDHDLILGEAGYIVLGFAPGVREALKAKDYDLLAVLGDKAEEDDRPFLAEALRIVREQALL